MVEILEKVGPTNFFLHSGSEKVGRANFFQISTIFLEASWKSRNWWKKLAPPTFSTTQAQKKLVGPTFSTIYWISRRFLCKWWKFWKSWPHQLFPPLRLRKSWWGQLFPPFIGFPGGFSVNGGNFGKKLAPPTFSSTQAQKKLVGPTFSTISSSFKGPATYSTTLGEERLAKLRLIYIRVLSYWPTVLYTRR